MEAPPTNPLWIDAEHPQAAAGVFLQTPDGRIILQLRDDIPGIDNPGMITAFAGAAEPGEGPTDCALRELEEETGIRSRPETLRLLGSVSSRDFRGVATACVFYLLIGIDPASLVVTEGKAIVLSMAEIATDPRVSQLCRALAARISHVLN